MKNVWRILLGTTAMIALLGCSQSLVSGQNEGKNDAATAGSKTIEGAWRTNVTPRNCQTGEPILAPFPGFLVFHEGGTVSGASATVVSADGVWNRQRAHNNYTFTTLSFRYAANGVFVGTQQINQEITIAGNGNEFTSTGTFAVFDVNGAQIQTGCATATGNRFK